MTDVIELTNLNILNYINHRTFLKIEDSNAGWLIRMHCIWETPMKRVTLDGVEIEYDEYLIHFPYNSFYDLIKSNKDAQKKKS